MNEPYVEPIAEESVADLPAEPMAEETAPPIEPEMPQDVTQRLAEDFLTLAEEFPHFVNPSQLPEGVLDIAAEQGISLLDAYLRYRLQEEKKVAAAVEKQREAAMQSAGSLSRGAVQTPPEQDAFLRAFRSAL